MKIEVLDPPYRFLVKSLTRKDNVHLVDLEEYDGYGECSCEYFSFRIRPELDNNNNPKKQCRHLRIVKQHLDWILKNKERSKSPNNKSSTDSKH